ncbi:MAG: hypothetical protein ABID79_06130 [Elusimicrobiota bacterium]
MKSKKTKLVLSISVVLIVITLYFLLHKEKKVTSIELNYEKFISSDVSVIIRFDNLSFVWSDFKKTNFYVHFKDFSKWFFKKLPSTTLSFTNDIKDVQKSIGFELSEKNILALIGKKVLLSMWLENPDDKKFLLISQQNIQFPLFNEGFNLIDKNNTLYNNTSNVIDEYKNVKIIALGQDKYWCLIGDMFTISNDIGNIKKCIDFSVNIPDNSIVDDAEFKKNIKEISSSNYIYVKPQKINLKKFDLVKNEAKTLIFSTKFEDGIKFELCIFRERCSKSVCVKKTNLVSFLSENVFFRTVGDFFKAYPVKDAIIKNLLLVSDINYILWLNKKESKIAIFCRVKNKKLFLNKFEENIQKIENNNIFEYKLPLLGLLQYKYFFIKNYFVICSPLSLEELAKNFIIKRKNLTLNVDSFKQLKTSKKSNEMFCADLSKIFANTIEKNCKDFLISISGCLITKNYGLKAIICVPTINLSSPSWAEIFSTMRKTVYKKIALEKEKITRNNLFYLREALDIYNSKTGRYPSKPKSLIDEYLNEIPQELLTKSNNVVKTQDGSGGWFYERGKVQLNVFGTDSTGNYYTQW